MVCTHVVVNGGDIYFVSVVLRFYFSYVAKESSYFLQPKSRVTVTN